MFGRFKAFVEEVRVELSKCVWPTREELVESTIVVIICCLILAGFVGLSDFMLRTLLDVLV